MRDISFKISVCPVCSKKLIEINDPYSDTKEYLCTDNTCRIHIVENHIDKLDISTYSRMVDGLNIQKQEYNTYMLLKENLSGPLLQKLTNDYNEKDRSMLCIIKANSREDAINKFKRKFAYIKVTSDMVVPISVKEEGW